MIQQRLRTSVKGLNFKTVAKAIARVNNLPHGSNEPLWSMLKKRGLSKTPVVCLSEVKVFRIIEGSKPPVLYLNHDREKWYLLTDEVVSYIRCHSYTSGSSIQAEKDVDGTWKLVLEVPIRGEEPYKGQYWTSFHRSLPPIYGGLDREVVE